MPARSRSSSRTDIRSPARAARRRMRWATWRARTQVNMCTRMLCSVQWCIGEKDTTWGSFMWRKENGLGLGPVAGHDLGDGPVVVAGDQDVLAEDLLFQRGAGLLVHVPGKPQVFRLLAGQFRADDAPHPRLCRDRGDFRLDFVPGPAGLPAGQRRGQLVELPAGLREGGASEARSL